jgi:transposase
MAIAVELGEVSGGEIHHLPIVAAYAHRIRLVEIINRLVPSEMEQSPGTLTLAMALDALSGRHPLYRIGAFFENKDRELLLGEEVDLDYLSDDTFGRLLDRLYEANTTVLFSEIAMSAFEAFGVTGGHIHFDTTSVRVYGAYDPPEDAEEAPPFRITYGYSKDHRPDLKQFLVSLLCVGGNVPFFGKMEDGNASDKDINNAVLSDISQQLARVGLDPRASIYIADSALVTEPNLTTMGDTTRFITRLPANFAEHERVIREAVAQNQWVDYGRLALGRPTPKRPGAYYRGYETTLTLYGRSYRAVVVHSSAHDRRRQKRLERRLAEERKAWTKRLQKEQKTLYFCRADAEVAAQALRNESRRYHDLEVTVEERPRYGPGRPRANAPRTIREMRYGLVATLCERDEAIAQAKEEAGCFVLITNVPHEGPPGSPVPYDGKTVLEAYKDQHGIERNFGFLKDPVIVNSLFLKRPERIEALGLILLIALLLWRLMERTMRRHVAETQCPLVGWDDRPTERPTAFMMTTKFEGVLVLMIGGQRQLLRPLSEVQQAYLRALGLAVTIFTQPQRARGDP